MAGAMARLRASKATFEVLTSESFLHRASHGLAASRRSTPASQEAQDVLRALSHLPGDVIGLILTQSLDTVQLSRGSGPYDDGAALAEEPDTRMEYVLSCGCEGICSCGTQPLPSRVRSETANGLARRFLKRVAVAERSNSESNCFAPRRAALAPTGRCGPRAKDIQALLSSPGVRVIDLGGCTVRGDVGDVIQLGPGQGIRNGTIDIPGGQVPTAHFDGTADPTGVAVWLSGDGAFLHGVTVQGAKPIAKSRDEGSALLVFRSDATRDPPRDVEAPLLGATRAAAALAEANALTPVRSLDDSTVTGDDDVEMDGATPEEPSRDGGRLRVQLRDCDLANNDTIAVVAWGQGVELEMHSTQVRDNAAGVLCYESAQLAMDACFVSGCRQGGVMVGGRTSHADKRATAAQLCAATIEGSEISDNCGAGVVISGDARVKVQHCSVSGTRPTHAGGQVFLIRFGFGVGLVCDDGATLSMEDCLVQGNEFGGLMASAPGSRVVAANCMVAHNKHWGAFANAGAQIDLKSCFLRRQQPGCSESRGMQSGGVFALSEGSCITVEGGCVAENAGFGVACASGGHISINRTTAVALNTDGNFLSVTGGMIEINEQEAAEGGDQNVLPQTELAS
ncbi:unnamed protein product [Pedinophyceae sp. YPF-701]|nr:unnamed protein product [Pedinophyceae sp. YPF-701]